MDKSRGKEFKLEVKENYKISYGSVDGKNPKAIFIKINAWGLPIDKGETDYTQVIKKMDKNLRSFVYNNINDNLFKKNNTILDLDLRESGISFNKKSFMSCEITLFQENNYELTSPLIINELKTFINKIIYEEFEKDKNFKFYKDKK